MRKRKHREGSLFAGFGIFPFSLVMLAVFVPVVGVLWMPIHHGGNVDLPKAVSSHLLRGAGREDALKVNVTRDSSLYLNYRKMNRSELTKLIRIAVAQGSPRHVYISADKFAAYSAVKQALDAIHDAGVEEISFVTEQR